jgi:hypothetical protein
MFHNAFSRGVVIDKLLRKNKEEIHTTQQNNIDNKDNDFKNISFIKKYKKNNKILQPSPTEREHVKQKLENINNNWNKDNEMNKDNEIKKLKSKTNVTFHEQNQKNMNSEHNNHERRIIPPIQTHLTPIRTTILSPIAASPYTNTTTAFPNISPNLNIRTVSNSNSPTLTGNVSPRRSPTSSPREDDSRPIPKTINLQDYKVKSYICI